MFNPTGTSVNDISVRSVYGGASGPTIGNRASALTPYDSGMPASQSGNTDTSGNVASTAQTSAVGSYISKGVFGQPMTWFLLIIAMLFGLRFVSHKLGEGEGFSNMKVSIHNVIVISFASIIGIGFFKVVFNKWRVPGLTDYINAV